MRHILNCTRKQTSTEINVANISWEHIGNSFVKRIHKRKHVLFAYEIGGIVYLYDDRVLGGHVRGGHGSVSTVPTILGKKKKNFDRLRSAEKICN